MEGSTIQNFEVTALIGGGGIGSVYLARHRIIDRKVAIKILHETFCQDATMVTRFLNEARVAHAVRHPNIVEIFDVGTLADGRPFIVMEYLEGESLATRLAREGKMAWVDVYPIAVQVADALESAHARRIVHRDIKPDNVFLMKEAHDRVMRPELAGTPTGAPPLAERVKLLDFGIAKIRDELAGSAIDTRDAILGSPLHMSPEQCRGMSDQIDQRTDVYSFGALLYQMLTGTPPFVSNSFGDVLMMHVAHKPRPLRAIEPSVPGAVEQAVLRALAKRPEERFDSASAFVTALAAARPPRRRAAGPGAPGGQHWSSWLKGPGGFTLVGLAASLLVAPLALERCTHGGATAAVRAPTIETLPSAPELIPAAAAMSREGAAKDPGAAPVGNDEGRPSDRPVEAQAGGEPRASTDDGKDAVLGPGEDDVEGTAPARAEVVPAARSVPLAREPRRRRRGGPTLERPRGNASARPPIELRTSKW